MAEGIIKILIEENSFWTTLYQNPLSPNPSSTISLFKKVVNYQTAVCQSNYNLATAVDHDISNNPG